MNAPTPRTVRLLRDGLAALGVDGACAPMLWRYLGELEKWNATYNLSGIRDLQGMVTRHVLDALAVLPDVRGRVIDVGSGPGIPGIILAIANPALTVTTLDSNGKKARFMRHAQRTLDLPNLEVVEGRAEAYEPAARFDTVISRAFAALGDFLGVTEALGADDGRWLAMKGRLDADERGDIPAGFRVIETKALSVPGLNEARHLIIATRT